MTINKNHLWMNKETGELMTYDEMVCEGSNLYDLDDDTNVCDFSEYYEDTGDEVPEDWNEWRDNEPDDIDDDMGFDPYEGCFTWDC